MIELTDREKAENERWRVLHTNAIESNSKWMQTHATDLAHHIRSLANLPNYETMAEDELDKAIIAVADLTLVLKVARSDL